MKTFGTLFMLLVALPGLLVSCYFPPYREELSLAVPVTEKMEGVTHVGPLNRGPWDFEGRDIVFYPSKDALQNSASDIVRGFIVATDERSARLMFVDHNGDEYYIGPDNTFPIENSDDREFVFRASTLEDGSDDGVENLGIIAFDNDTLMREYIVFDQWFTWPPPSTDLNSGFLALGAGFFPDDTGQNWFYTLRVNLATGLYTEEEYNADTAAPGGWLRGPLFLPGLPEDMTNCHYSLRPAPISPTNRAYLSVYDPVRRRYRNFSWDDALQLQILADMDRRIDLVLSNGWLFSREGNSGYVYDGEGELLNSFLMGGLNLVYELFDGSVYRAVFTIPVWAPVRIDGDYWEDRLFFLVYWIPTEQLADL